MYAFFEFASLVTTVTTFASRPLLRDLDEGRLAFDEFPGSAFNGSAWLAFEGLRPGESVRCDRLRDFALLSFEGLRCGRDWLRRSFWLTLGELRRRDRLCCT